MKKILLLLTAFATLATMASAKEQNGIFKDARSPINAKSTRFMAPLINPVLVNDSKTNHNNVLATTNYYTVIDSISATYVSYSSTYGYSFLYGSSVFFGDNSKPFYFDPATSLYSYIQMGYGANGDLSDADNSFNSINLRTSTDFTTWSNRITVATPSTDELHYYPSVATISGSGENKAIISSFAYNSTEQIREQNVYVVDLDNNSQIDVARVGDPTDANNDEYRWGTESFVSPALSSTNLPNALVTSASQCVGSIKPSGFGVATSSNLVDWTSSMPSGISDDAFYNDGHYLWSNFVGLSKAGNRTYFGAYGRFTGSDNYTLGFSYTDDFGSTWSNFTYAPYQLFKDYMNPLIKKADSFYVTINPNAFVALSNGNVYFAAELTELNSDSTDHDNGVYADSSLVHQIVEVSYEKNAWKIRYISAPIKYSYSRPIMTYYDSETSDIGAVYSQGGSEIQLAKTMDEKFIVVKWLYGNYGNFTNYGLLSYGWVMGGARCVGNNTNVWKSGQIIFPKSPAPQSMHFLPNVVPNAVGQSINNIPMLAIKAIYLGTETTTLDSLVTATRIDYPKYVATTKFSLTKLDTTVSVEENTGAFAQNLSIDNIFPNPNTGESVDLKLTLNQEAYTTIQIFDILGRLVAEPFSGYLASGEQFKSLTNLNLSSGSYRLVVTSNNSKASKTLNVAR